MKHKTIIMITAGIIALAVGAYLTYAAGSYQWPFTSTGNYTLSDSSKIEITGGSAQLKQQASSVEESTMAGYNSGVHSDTTSGPDASLILSKTGSLYDTSGDFTSRVIDGGSAWDSVTDSWSTIDSSATGIISGLVGLWNMDESTASNGTAIADALGNNDGTLTTDNGAVEKIVSGKLNNALSFDGTGDYVQISNESNFDFDGSDPFSISFWVKRVGTGAQTIIAKMGPWPYTGWTVMVNSNIPALVFQLSKSGSSIIQIQYDETLVPVNIWTHIAATYDGSASASGAIVYVNGVEDASRFESQDNLVSSMLNDEEVIIGGRDNGISTLFTGQIDEVAIYNRALSAMEISAQYAGGSGIEVNNYSHELAFRVRSGATSSACQAATFVGPDDTADTYYHGNSQALDADGTTFDDALQYIQYKAFLNSSSDNSETPNVASVSLTSNLRTKVDTDLMNFTATGTVYSSTTTTLTAVDPAYVGLAKMTNGGYASYGTYTSAVLNAGAAGAAWSNIAWSLGAGVVGEIGSSENGLVGLWHMNNNWLDATTNNNDGTAYGDTAFITSAKLGSHAGTFDGTGDYIGGFTESNFDFSGSFTLEVWFKRGTGISATETLISKFTPSTGNRSYYLSLTLNGYAQFYAITTGGKWATDTVNIADGAWHHIAGVYDETASQVKVYVDGVLRDTDIQSGTPQDSPTDFFIGKRDDGYSFNGQIDEVAIYNRALSTDEIASRAGGTVKFQVRAGGSNPPTGNFVDGSASASGFITSSGSGFTANPSGRYFQYRAYLEGTSINNATPTLESVTLTNSTGNFYESDGVTVRDGTDNARAEFDTGTYFNTSYYGDELKLTAVDITATTGTFTSQALGSSAATWNTLNWVEEAPYGEAIKSNNGLVGLWHMNGDWLDAAGGNNGTRYGSGTAFTTASKLGSQAGQFDGTSDYIDLPDGLDDNLSDFTFMAWVYWTSTDQWDRIMDFGSATSPGSTTGEYMLLTTRGDSLTVEFAITLAGYSNDEVIAGSVFPANQWAHVAVTLDGNTGNIYLNGNLDVTGAITLNPSDLGAVNNWLGRSQYGAPDFNGSIDEVAIYDRALSLSEVQAHYNSNSPSEIEVPITKTALTSAEPGLVGLWHMDEVSGTLADSSSNNNVGTVTGATYGAAGKMGNALSFAGSDSIAIGNAGSVNTVEFWINNSNDTDNVLELSSTVNADITIATGSVITAGDGFTSPAIYVNGNSSSAVLASGWNHVAVVTSTAVTADTFNIATVNATAMTSGTLDEVAIYNRALSAAEIKQHYMDQSGDRGLVGLWHLDEASGSVLDSSGQGNTGIVSGDPVYEAAGKFTSNKALTLDGTGDYITIGDIGTVRTVEFWITGIGASDEILELSASDSLSTDAGSNVVVTGFGTETVYVNGSSAAATLVSGWNHVAVVSDTALTADAVILGRVSGADMAGTLDEVAIYNRALSAGEILDHYRAGAANLKMELSTDGLNWVKEDNTVGSITSNSQALSGITGSSIQYRVALTTTDSSYAPKLYGVKFSQYSYPTDVPYVTTNVGFNYLTTPGSVESFSDSVSGTVRYRLSNDGTNWNYYNTSGSAWTGTSAAYSTGTTNPSSELTNAVIQVFDEQVGKGSLYARVYLESPGLTQVSVDSVDVVTVDDALSFTSVGGATYPNTSLLFGTAYSGADGILWSNTGYITNVRIEFNDTTGWQDVVSSTVNDGSYDWTVPVVQATSSTQMRISDVTDSNVSVSSLNFTIGPAVLTNTDIVPVSFVGGSGGVAGAEGNVTVNFTMPSTMPVPADGLIQVIFPSGFTLNSGGTTAASIVSGIDGTLLSTGVSGQVVTITRNNDGSAISGAMSLLVSNVKNPTALASTGTYSIQTQNSIGSVMAWDMSVAADTIFGVSFTSPVSSTEWAVGDLDRPITWTESGTSDSLVFQYYDGGWVNCQNDGSDVSGNYTSGGDSALWDISTNTAISSTHRVRAYDTTAGYSVGESEQFTIIGGITLSAPIGGANWSIDVPQQITWVETGTFSQGAKVLYSTNSTNGTDGTWNAMTVYASSSNAVSNTGALNNTDDNGVMSTSGSGSCWWLPSRDMGSGSAGVWVKVANADTSVPVSSDVTSSAITVAKITSVDFTLPERSVTAVQVGPGLNTDLSINITSVGMSNVTIEYKSNAAGGSYAVCQDSSGGSASDIAVSSLPFVWRVPDDVYSSGGADIRVTVSASSGVTGALTVTSSGFTIYGSLTRTAPVSGSYSVNDSSNRVSIVWTGSSSISAIKFQYTQDFISPNWLDCASAGTIYDDATAGTAGQYNWSGGSGTAWWQPNFTDGSLWLRIIDNDDYSSSDNTAQNASSSTASATSLPESFGISGVSILGVTATSAAGDTNYLSVITVGTTYYVKGTGTTPTGNVNLYYATDSGFTSPVSLGAVALSSGDYTYAWTIPDVISDTIYLKVTDPDSESAIYQVTGSAINIQGALTVSTPSDWTVGAAANTQITGTVTGDIDTVDIEYTTNGGTNWTNLAAGISIGDNSGTSSGAFTAIAAGTFSVPDVISSSFNIRLKDATSGRASGARVTSSASASTFTVKGLLAFDAGTSTGSNSWYVGTSPTVGYNVTGSGFNSLVISYGYRQNASQSDISTDYNANGWTQIASLSTAGYFGTGTSAAARTYAWSQIADVVETLLGSSADEQDPSVYAVSGNECWLMIKLEGLDASSNVIADAVYSPGFRANYYKTTWQVQNLSGGYIGTLNVSESAVGLKPSWTVSDWSVCSGAGSGLTYQTVGSEPFDRYYPYSANNYDTNFTEETGGAEYSASTAWQANQDQTLTVSIDTSNVSFNVEIGTSYDYPNNILYLTTWLERQGLQLTDVQKGNLNTASAVIKDSSGNTINASSITSAAADTSGIYWLNWNTDTDQVDLVRGRQYLVEITINYGNVTGGYKGTQTFTLESTASYDIQIDAMYDSNADAILITTSLLQNGALVSDNANMSLSSLDVLDSSGNSVISGIMLTGVNYTTTDITNSIYHTTWDPLAGLSPNTTYTILSTITYKGNTYSGNKTVSTSVSETYQVYIDPIYDKTNDAIDISVWLSMGGQMVTDPGNLSAFGIVDSSGSSLLGGADLTQTSGSANAGIYSVTWDPSGGLSGSTVYNIKASIVYRNSTYSNATAFNVTSDKAISGIGTQVSSVGSQVSGVSSAVGGVSTQVTGVATNVGLTKTAAEAASTASAATRGLIGGSTDTASTTVFGRISGLSSVIGTTADTTASSTVFGKLSSVRTDVSAVQRKIASGILNRETVAKIGGTITIKYKDASGQIPTIDVYNGSNSKVVSNTVMSEIGSTGVYSYSLTLQRTWGKGDYTVITSNASSGKVDSMVLSVISTDLEDISGDISYIYTLGVPAQKSDVTGVSAKVDALSGNLSSVIAQLSAISAKAGAGGGEAALNTAEIYSQLSSIKAELSGINKEQNVGFDAMKLYDLSRESSSDLHYIKNKTLELKAMIEMNKKIIESQLNKPVIKTWFENGR